MKNIILDTDIGPDCDDAGALAILNILADKGYCCILGVTHCTSNPYGAGTIDAINRYFGRPQVMIGSYSGTGFLDDEICKRYNRYITNHLPNRYRDRQPEDAVKVFRHILSEQCNKSVEIIGIGPMINLSNLLNSEPDIYSELTGLALIEKKVTRLTVMGGVFRGSCKAVSERVEQFANEKIEKIVEWNIGMNVPAAINVATHWPTPKIYVGLEAGLIITGQELRTKVPEEHPVRVAYQLHNQQGVRYSWDLVTVEHAVVDKCPYYHNSAKGIVRFDEKGRTIWKKDEEGQDCFLEFALPEEEISAHLNEILITPPRRGIDRGMIEEFRG